MTEYGDYIVYVDESGDHGLEKINSHYPIFVLTFCIFKKSDYANKIMPAVTNFKFQYWGHGDTILHEHEIRKVRSGDWAFLSDKAKRKEFMKDYSVLIEDSNFHVISAIIDKRKMKALYQKPFDIYETALLFCMERLNGWLKQQKQHDKIIPIHFEARGKNEDNSLELEFHRIISGDSSSLWTRNDFSNFSYKIRFLPKTTNTAGLQITDLIARPIGLSILKPEQQNQAYNIIKEKIITKKPGEVHPYGLKIFP